LQALCLAQPKSQPKLLLNVTLAKGFFLLHHQPFLILTAALHTILLTAKLMKTFLRGGYQYPISDFHAGIVG
jgi:hypothetical protein